MGQVLNDAKDLLLFLVLLLEEGSQHRIVAQAPGVIGAVRNPELVDLAPDKLVPALLEFGHIFWDNPLLGFERLAVFIAPIDDLAVFIDPGMSLQVVDE